MAQEAYKTLPDRSIVKDLILTPVVVVVVVFVVGFVVVAFVVVAILIVVVLALFFFVVVPIVSPCSEHRPATPDNQCASQRWLF